MRDASARAEREARRTRAREESAAVARVVAGARDAISAEEEADIVFVLCFPLNGAANGTHRSLRAKVYPTEGSRGGFARARGREVSRRARARA